MVSVRNASINLQTLATTNGGIIFALDPTILFCGRLSWQKGPDILVEAIPPILRQHPSSRFVFVGDGDMRDALQWRIRQLGMAHAVRFLGYRNGDELVRLYKLAEVVCMPSRNEPFGIVVLEASSTASRSLPVRTAAPRSMSGMK